MGSELSAEEKKSRAIDGQLMVAKKKEDSKIKLLILGAGESGKSTLFKQMKILYLSNSKSNHFSTEELAHYRNVIHTNIVSGMKDLLKAAPKFGKVVKEDEAAKVMDWSDSISLGKEEADILSSLWKDDGIQLTWRNRSELHVQDNLSYYISSIKRICQQDLYTPTKDDIVRSREITTEVSRMTFKIKHSEIEMFDVGGQRTHRKKWLHHFDDVTAMIFVAAISEYDQVLVEDNGTNRQKESVQLFREQLKSPYFKDCPIILFLNKKDLLREKLPIYPFKVTSGLNKRNEKFRGKECIMGKSPPYSTLGDDPEFEECYDHACMYLQELYQAQAKKLPIKRTGEIYAHLTDSTSTENIGYIMNSCAEILLRKNLQQIGFYKDI